MWSRMCSTELRFHEWSRGYYTLFISRKPDLFIDVEAASWNTVVSYHCPSFRDWRPRIILGAFFFRRFVINGRHERNLH